MAEGRPVAIDLFAGAGGFSLGLEQAGFDIVAAVEYDPIHAATHELNFPYTAVICRDVSGLSGDAICETAGIERGTIDAVVGGPPCQGFSLIGQRVLDDPRNSLVFHFLRLVVELEPRTFVMENVPGMATGEHTQLLQELVDRFQEAGYRVKLPYRTLNAANYGVPQNRERVFLLGARSGTRVPEYPKATTALRANGTGGSSQNLSLPLFGIAKCPSVEEAIGDLPEIEDHEDLYDSDVLNVGLRGGSKYARVLRGELEDPEDYSYRRERDPQVLTGCGRARHTEKSRRRFAATEPGTTEGISRFFKLAWDGMCHTLRAGTASDRGAFTAPRPIHPAQPRCISVREAARLHSYPDWFRFHRTIWHGFRQIGNSVPPLLGRAVGVSLRDAIGAEPIKPEEVLQLGPQRLALLNMRKAASYYDVSRTVIARRRRGTEAGAG